MKQKMFTKEQYEKLVANYKAQDGSKTFKAVVKLFNPSGLGTWYLSELNPETNEAFGLSVVSSRKNQAMCLLMNSRKLNALLSGCQLRETSSLHQRRQKNVRSCDSVYILLDPRCRFNWTLGWLTAAASLQELLQRTNCRFSLDNGKDVQITQIPSGTGGRSGVIGQNLLTRKIF